MFHNLPRSTRKPAVHQTKQDHGGGIDSAALHYGGKREDWVDLSTGINPRPYPVGQLDPLEWTALPDQAAYQGLVHAARSFWNVPGAAAILPAPGASSLIARVPALADAGRVRITTPTYNEHAAAFAAAGWETVEDGPTDARVLVHPNNPDGRRWHASDANARLNIIDESFCEVTPDASLIHLADQPNNLILKSFGKFWGLAGLRLGFAIGSTEMINQLSTLLGPWPVSGPALHIGTTALRDTQWAEQTRYRLGRDAARLDQVMFTHGARLAGGTDLFRLYEVDDARHWQDRLARHQIWTRIFPYSKKWLRMGLPPEGGWDRLMEAL